MQEGSGALIVTEETLVGQSLDGLTMQPPWSGLPAVLLAAQRMAPRPVSAEKALADLGNIIVLERPLDGESSVKLDQL